MASSSTGDCGLGSEPGSSVEDVRLGYRGTEGLKVGADGDLLVLTSLGVLKDAAPVGYQLIGGERIPVESRYGHGDYGFRVGAARLLHLPGRSGSGQRRRGGWSGQGLRNGVEPPTSSGGDAVCEHDLMAHPLREPNAET
jgi:hypothetical protein